jgi:hypothetical protein
MTLVIFMVVGVDGCGVENENGRHEAWGCFMAADVTRSRCAG